MARYHCLELHELIVVPLPGGVSLRMVVTEDGDKETVRIYCPDKKFGRFMTALRHYPKRVDNQSDGEPLDDTKLPRPELTIKRPYNYDPRGDHYFLQSVDTGIMYGREATTGCLRFNTDYEEIPVRLARNTATEIRDRLHELEIDIRQRIKDDR